MIENIKRFFLPPKFDNEELNQRSATLNSFSLGLIFVLILVAFIYLFTEYDGETLLVIFGLIAAGIFTQILLRLKRLILSGILLILAGWALITYQAYTSDGVRDVIIFSYIALAFLSNVFLSQRIATITLTASMIAIWVLAFAEQQGYIIYQGQETIAYARDASVIIVVIAILAYLIANNLRNALNQSRKVTAELASSNFELEKLRAGLEEQVEERTRALEVASERVEKRARQYQAVARVSRDIAALHELDDLLPMIANTIAEFFGYYNVNIFLRNNEGDRVELTAASSIGGQSMLGQGHSMQVGKGIIGTVAQTGTTYIVNNVKDDEIFIPHPALPETRSEIALPLTTGNTVIGVLDVQSNAEASFKDDDVEVLSTLSFQVSTAIENARLFSESRKALVEAQRSYQEFLSQEWQSFTERQIVHGYMFENGRSIAMETGTKEIPNALTVPVMIRGEMIGEIAIDTSGRIFSDEEMALIRAASERAALALENARLIDSTRERARLERTIADVSSSIGSGSDFDNIMRTTVEELGRVLSAQEIFIRIKDVEM